MRHPIFLLVIFHLPLLAQEEDPLATRDEWSVVSYSFPSHPLAYGFTSRERGHLRAPQLPPEDAAEEEVDTFLKRSHQIVGHFLEGEGVSLPEGSLITFDPESLTLVARVPGLTHWSLQSMAEALERDVPQFMAMQGIIVEAPRDEVIELVPKATPLLDHSDLLADLKGRPNTDVLQTMHLQSRSGQLSQSSETTETIQPEDWELRDTGFLRFGRSMESDGTTWKLDAVIGADGETVDVSVSVSRPLGPPEEKQEVMTKWQEKDMVALHRNQSTASVDTSLTFRSGETRLIGVWPSTNEARLQSAFLGMHLVRTLPLRSKRLLGMVEERGETVQPIPEGKPKFFEDPVEGIPEGMFVQRFRIPPSFLSSGGDGGGRAMEDPFADAGGEPTFTIRATAMDILKSVGVQFPPGSSANYLPRTSELVVRNTPENLDLVAAYVSSLKMDVQKTIILTAYVVEASDEEILQVADQMLVLPDHRHGLQALRGADGAKVLSLAWIEARSGQLAKVTAGKEFTYVSGIDVASESSKNEEEEKRYEEFSFHTDVEQVGTTLEVDPVIGADGVTLDLNVSLDYDYAEPAWQGEFPEGRNEIIFTGPRVRFFRSHQLASLTMRSGSTRMLGHWVPEGKENAQGLRQVAFIRASILSREEEEDGSIDGRRFR